MLGGAAIALLLSVGAARDLRLPPGEHAFLLLCATTGALALAGARDLLTLVVALEVSALPAVALVALRREDRRGGEAGAQVVPRLRRGHRGHAVRAEPGLRRDR